jgi:hypothetical protein
MRRTSTFILALAAGALVCASAQAETKRRQPPASQVERAAAAAELTVTKRSWLDPGNVVPVGTQDRYVQNVKYPSTPAPGGTYRNDNFGDWLLPQWFPLPGFQR